MTLREDLYALPQGYVDGRRELEDAPARIVEDGRLRLGFFRAPPRRMNLDEARLLDGRVRQWWGAPRLMEWVGCGIAHPRYYVGVIVVNAQSASLCVLYAADRRTGESFRHESLSPASRARVAETTWADETWFRKAGLEVAWEHRLGDGFHRLRVDIEGRRGRPPVRGELRFAEDLGRFQPLVTCVPVGERRFVFGHKAQMPVEGRLRVGDEVLEYDPGRDVANLDELKSVSPLRNRYRWVNLGGIDGAGRIVGLNAMDNVHRLQDYWYESCVWVDGALTLLGAVRIDHDPADLTRPWQISEPEGRVSLTLHPEGGMAVRLRPFVSYHQKCGAFSGTLIDGAGEHHEVRDFCGCAEDMRVL